MSVEVKICGLRSRTAVDAALDAGADMLGFVFFEKSPRHVSLADAAELINMLPAAAVSVMLVVDVTDKVIDEISSTVRPTMLQVHGSETPRRVAEISARSGLPVIKALGIANADDIDAARSFQTSASRVLFDAHPPKGADRPGGHGKMIDWRLARSYNGNITAMLSGGLTPHNVAKAISASGLYAVDVSSGVESRPGVKDSNLIHQFVRAARGGVPS
jgi:phosphoribosylanthranilate isomerase